MKMKDGTPWHYREGPGVTATVNGLPRSIADGATIATLLRELGTCGSGVAVARNDRVVRRAEYESHRIADGDRIEIITAVAGG